MKWLWIYIICIFLSLPLRSQSFSPVVFQSPITNSFHSSNSNPVVAHTENGDFFIAWQSSRKDWGYSNIYVQKFDSEGVAQWESDGNRISPTLHNQQDPKLVSDSKGGVIVAWLEQRDTKSPSVIKGLRLSASGQNQWKQGAVQLANTKGNVKNLDILDDERGNLLIVWEENRDPQKSRDLFMQKVSYGGEVLWESTGKPINSHTGIQRNMKIIKDGHGGFFVLWEDFRSASFWHLFVQHISYSGRLIWHERGVPLIGTKSENQEKGTMVLDGNGGVIFSYQKRDSVDGDYDIYRGRMDADMEKIFHYATCRLPDDQKNPSLIRRGEEVIITWEDGRNNQNNLYIQKFSSKSGIVSWQGNGIPISQEGRNNQLVMGMPHTGENHFSFWISKTDRKEQIRMENVNLQGLLTHKNGGKVITSPQNYISDLSYSQSSDGGGVLCWSQKDSRPGKEIKFQIISPQGVPILTKPKSVGVENKTSQVVLKNLSVTKGMGEDFFLMWEDNRNGDTNWDIYVQKVDTRGRTKWKNGGIPVVKHPHDQKQPKVCSDGSGGLFVVWQDFRTNNNPNLFAQRLSSNGTKLWGENGVLVCDAPRSQTQQVLSEDGDGGLLLCWVDARNIESSSFDLFCQKFNNVGDPLWDKNGKELVKYEGFQTSPMLVNDVAGGAYVIWMDNRSPYSNIYLQQLDSYGRLKMGQNGAPVFLTSNHQRHPFLSGGDDKDVYMAWEDDRFGDRNEKIFLQKIDVNGYRKWGFDGKRVSLSRGRQHKPRHLVTREGRLLLTWLDGRSEPVSGYHLVGQLYNSNGYKLWEENGTLIGKGLKENNDYSLVSTPALNTGILWNSIGSHGSPLLKFQYIDLHGKMKYDEGGIFVAKVADGQYSPGMISKGENLMVLCWINENLKDKTFSIQGVFINN